MEKQQNRIFANCSQTVRNHCEFRNGLAISSQPLRISQCVGNQFRIAKITNPSALYLCEIRLSQNLSEISHCEIRKPHCEFCNSIAKFANHIANFANNFAKFANPLPNSQTTLPTSQTHCQIRNLSWHCEIHICRPCHPL